MIACVHAARTSCGGIELPFKTTYEASSIMRKTLASIDDIDPDGCDYIHNINACTAEELEELGNLAAIS